MVFERRYDNSDRLSQILCGVFAPTSRSWLETPVLLFHASYHVDISNMTTVVTGFQTELDSLSY